MRAATLLVAAAVAIASGCHTGEGKGALSGTLFIEECTTDHGYPRDGGAASAFDLHPMFFVAEPANDLPRRHPMNRLSIRIQSSGNRIEEADVFFLNIADLREVALALGQPLPVGPNTNVRASMILNRTCPAHQVELELDGTIIFAHLGSASGGADAGVPDDFRISFGDQLTAAISFDVVDRRAIALGGSGSVSTVPTASGHLDGNFDFLVRQSTSAQSHP